MSEALPVCNRLFTAPISNKASPSVKAQTATMKYTNMTDGITYLLNLIDTPGHVDFSWEVSRSLNASEGAILLVDSTREYIGGGVYVPLVLMQRVFPVL